MGLEITKIVASRPKCVLGVARSAPDVHFADSVEELSILRLRDRGAHFGDRISLCFSVILRDFGTLSPSKATPGTAKVNAFYRFWTRHGLGCLFCDCDIGMHVFSCSFCVGFERVLGPFCVILGTRPATKPRSTNGP